MQEEAYQIKWTKSVEKSIIQITTYIAEQGNPERAETFYLELEEFGNKLAVFPEKYAICRHATYARRKCRCAVFEGTYIFIYKVVKKRVVIYNVIHGKRLR